MEIINSKIRVKVLVNESLGILKKNGQNVFVQALSDNLLRKKIRFPLLEYAASELLSSIPPSELLEITDQIIALREMGSQVLAGIILQEQLANDYDRAISKACEYIQYGDTWYVCDIIGERVLGYSLLTNPEKTIPTLKQLALHEDKWLVRTVGVAAHYAVKKRLSPYYVNEVFKLLLSCGTTTEFHTKKGIGWGAKTIARFHPEIIAQYQATIDSPATKQWFRTKINIGLQRNKKV